MFVHETLPVLLAAGRQQGRNPYEEFRRIARNNEMISRTQALPAVVSSGQIRTNKVKIRQKYDSHKIIEYTARRALRKTLC